MKLHKDVNPRSIVVDASTSPNPGATEFNLKDLTTGITFYRSYKYPYATNNIGEFLALCKGLAYLKSNRDRYDVVYTDSLVAINWVFRLYCGVNYKLCDKLCNDIEACQNFLNKNTGLFIYIKKWETDKWGENPADYGRK